MAGWSTFSNGSSLEVGPYLGNGCGPGKNHVDNATDNDKDDKKCLFYQLYPVFLKGSCSNSIGRHLPVLIGDHQLELLDLYKLFSLVKGRGGYAKVSNKGLWRNVTKELGLKPELLASVKLIYDKYLNDFESWLRKTFEENNSKTGNQGCDPGFKSLPIGLEKEFRELLCPNLKGKDDDELVLLELKKIRKYIDFVNGKGDTNLRETKNKNKQRKDAQPVDADSDENPRNGIKDDPATLGVEGSEKEFTSRKRKRDPLSGMLNWIKKVAVCPLDSLTQPIPKPSKLKEYKGLDLFGQILRAKEVRLVKKHMQPKSRSYSFQKLRIHPAMYEDPVALGKSRSRNRYIASAPNGNRLASSHNTEEKEAAVGDEEDADEPPSRQAEVPEWTGLVSESDSKWLGTQVWPLKQDSKPATEADFVPIIKEQCSCEYKGSVECTRFHIAENRMKLKRELGSVFFRWGFHRMGEEVSLQWTPEEEKKFNDIMRTHVPAQVESLWTNPSRYFPKKTIRNLASYYFNVYLIQKRCYQNRVTPKNVDSDDDEVAFGSFGDGFGMEALKYPATDFLECPENKQCTDFE